ncbi:DUF2129 domain-containing protein [Gemella sp. GH3]|uniref:DUF2129 domain-containing protein n=1 Tax=unclassified Gemella TaxID=2624949 RepID=UPI0015D0CFFD|nr:MULTISPECIES: DUF2129 domain-containing protein [unclassified Gemella]MBF0714327.1 DUF2129 domain-containing protein [Gemella sp. GH3.1]NYS51279.1 DUF2129 domain-containing protein [Gemella sp. GH3]
MELFEKKRQGIYVYFKHVRDIQKLEKYGNVICFSKKNRYICLYVDASKANNIIEDLESKKYVKKIIKSELTEFSFKLSGLDKSFEMLKEY